MPRLLALWLMWAAAGSGSAPAHAAPLDPLYRRIAADLRAGRPLVVTVHVPLCDNRDIWCGSARLGVGDRGGTNLYWGAAAGLRAWFDHRRRFQRVLRDHPPSRAVLERVVYRHRVRHPGPRWRRFGVTRGFTLYLVGIAYRGRAIGTALRRFVREVSTDRGARLRLPDGTALRVGGASHVVGYAGHNRLMDEPGFRWPAFTRRRVAGWFVLACRSAQHFSAHLTRPTTRALLMTRVLMYPGAFTVEGLLRGLGSARSQRGVFRQGARYYARYQKRPVRLIRRLFTHGARAAYRRRYARPAHPHPRRARLHRLRPRRRPQPTR